MRVLRASSFLRGLFAAFAVGVLLAGCGSVPKVARDGPGANPPPGLAGLPDAEPRIDAIRPGGANKPYQALGRDYVPITRDIPFSERGLASWYGRQFHGRRTASGETYDMYAMTAAHPTLPLPSYARIRNPANGREVIVRVNDRGPFHAGRIVDLSYAAALRLDLLRGVAPVELERITFDEIRAGTWRHGDQDATRMAAATSRTKAKPPSEPVNATVDAPVVATVAALPAEAAEPPPSAALPMPAADMAVASVAPAAPAASPMPTRGFWVQLGAFRESGGAENFQRRVGAEVEWLAPLLATFGDAALFRVQAGPYASRDDAQGAAARVREVLGLVPLIVERH
ncbi:MAG: septal ring lytic transglycosylase RlpA family protein [Caldimonas sp.]